MKRSRAQYRGPVSRDLTSAVIVAAIYTLSQGMSVVAVPLLALSAGYSATGIGALVAVSALSQILSRLSLPAILRRFPDWTLIAAAGVVLAASNAVAAWSSSVVALVVAQSLQGVSRASFWTGSQTHAVRGDRPAAATIATVNFTGGVGLLVGPVVAGVLSERTPVLALSVAAGIAVMSTAPTFLLDRLPPFVPPLDRPAGRMWRRPGVDVGCLAGVTAGAWRSIVAAYVPVALDAARQPTSVIGVLVTVANAAALVGSGVAGRLRGPKVALVVLGSIITTGVATALTGVLASHLLLYAIVLGFSGLAVGLLEVLGVSIASEAVHREERGEAITVIGTFRATALFAAPVAVAGLVVVLPLASAVAAVGVTMVLPALALPRRAVVPRQGLPLLPGRSRR